MTRSAAHHATFVAVTLTLLVAHAAARAECFSMYNARNALVYQSGTSPIDLSRPISEEMARNFPARTLVISTTIYCGDDGGGSGAPGGGDGNVAFGGTSATPVAPRSAVGAGDDPVRTRAPARGR